MKRWLLLIVYQLLAVLLILALGEFAIRFIRTVPEVSPRAYYYSNLLGDYMPSISMNADLPLQSPYQFTTNSQGFRSLKELDLSHEKIRVLLLGDSHSMGWGVDDAEVLSTHLEHLLTAKFQHPVEVVNSSLIQTNALDQYIYYDLKGYKLKPDLVISQFFWNDISGEIGRGRYFLRFPFMEPYSPWHKVVFWVQKSALYNWLAQLMASSGGMFDGNLKLPGNKQAASYLKEHQLEQLLVDESINPLGSLEQLLDENQLERFQPFWNGDLGALERLHLRLKQEGVPFLLFSIPDEMQMRFYLQGPETRLSQFSEQKKVPYLSLLPAYRGAFVGDLGSPYIPVDHHINKLGHQIAAQEIAKHIRLRSQKVEIDEKNLGDLRMFKRSDLVLDPASLKAQSPGWKLELNLGTLTNPWTKNREFQGVNMLQGSGKMSIEVSGKGFDGFDLILFPRIFNDAEGANGIQVTFEGQNLFEMKSDRTEKWSSTEKLVVIPVHFSVPRNRAKVELSIKGQGGLVLEQFEGKSPFRRIQARLYKKINRLIYNGPKISNNF
ncbi:MAG: hypothetical protein RRB13_03040 [bacterium]|nr:hypothetical protein [bacterium]